jgi:hypothetical protein
MDWAQKASRNKRPIFYESHSAKKFYNISTLPDAADEPNVTQFETPPAEVDEVGVDRNETSSTCHRSRIKLKFSKKSETNIEKRGYNRK